MFPNTPQPPTPEPSPTDYLNQIAAKPTSKMPFVMGPKLIAVIGGALILVIVIVAVTINIVTQNARSPLEHLAARLASTTTIVDGTKDSLKSNELRSLNSSLSIYISDINRDIAAPLKSAGVSVDKLSDKVIASESASTIAAKLEDARLNAVYDRTYAREMAYRLETIIALMKQIEASSGNKTLKEFLSKSYLKLAPSQKALSEFNDTSN